MSSKKEDLGIKIGTPEQAYWENVLEQSKKLLLDAHANIEINQMIVKLAEKKIKEKK